MTYGVRTRVRLARVTGLLWSLTDPHFTLLEIHLVFTTIHPGFRVLPCQKQERVRPVDDMVLHVDERV